MNPAQRVSPVRGDVELVESARETTAAGGRTTWVAGTRFVVDEHEPVFAGHYPDSPIFPGVCLVECAHRSAMLAAPDGVGELRLAGLASVRFRSAVLPGDVLRIALEWRADDAGWRCSAQVVKGAATAASIGLRYADAAGGAP